MNTSLYRILRRLGWGFVIVMVDIHIVFFDLLPDFIGYIMIALALHQMSFLLPLFNKPKWIAYVMIFLSVPKMFMQTNVDFSNFSSIPFELQVYSQVLLALHVLLVFWIFNGLGVMAQKAGQTVLLESVNTRRNLFLTVYVSQLIFYPFLLNVDDSWIMLLIVFVVLSFIMELLFIRLPFRFSKITSQLMEARNNN